MLVDIIITFQKFCWIYMIQNRIQCCGNNFSIEIEKDEIMRTQQNERLLYFSIENKYIELEIKYLDKK